MQRRALPEDHPDIATSINNLAALYEKQRRYKEAEVMYVEALAMQRRALPEDHPDIAISLWNLALMYETMKQYEKALPMVEEARTIWLAAHGPEHEHTRMAAGKIEDLRQLMGVEVDNELDEDDLQATLTTLQEMGFTDDVLNLQAIETHGNNIDAIIGAVDGVGSDRGRTGDFGEEAKEESEFAAEKDKDYDKNAFISAALALSLTNENHAKIDKNSNPARDQGEWTCVLCDEVNQNDQHECQCCGEVRTEKGAGADDEPGKPL
jgi:tetratricopeptide (TPR) repeat protein